MNDVFRCDYCGNLTALDDSVTFFEFTEDLDDGRRRFTPAVYCSQFCGRTATSTTGSGRG